MNQAAGKPIKLTLTEEIWAGWTRLINTNINNIINYDN